MWIVNAVAVGYRSERCHVAIHSLVAACTKVVDHRFAPDQSRLAERILQIVRLGWRGCLSIVDW
jgi:hypothetical protein